MICQTIKNGIECGFMTKKGCGFNGGSCNVIIDKCEGCSKVIECPTGKYCRVYPDPAGKWRTGKCPDSHPSQDRYQRNDAESQPAQGVQAGK